MRLAIRERIRRMGLEGIGEASLGLHSLGCMGLSLRRDTIFSWHEVDAGSMLHNWRVLRSKEWHLVSRGVRGC